MHGGYFEKSITVFSNARNYPTLKLSICGIIKEIIAVSPKYIRFKAHSDDSIKIKINCEKPDLEINKVTFYSHLKNDTTSKVFDLDFSLLRFDSTSVNGYYNYTLTILPGVKINNPFYGECIIKTNHPAKRKLVIRAAVTTKKN